MICIFSKRFDDCFGFGVLMQGCPQKIPSYLRVITCFIAESFKHKRRRLLRNLQR